MAGNIRVVDVSGSPYEVGLQHGRALRDAIRELTEDRVQLCSDPNWTGRDLDRADIIALGEACLEAHLAYAPELVEELRGIADATGLSLAELVIMNGFTDFIDLVYNADQFVPRREPLYAADDCTAFIVPDAATAEAQGFYGQTWDMHATATPYVILLRGRPDDAPAFLTFTLTGCVGMIGMNAAGIAIGVNNLMARDGQVGVTWPFVIRKALAQTELDAALECVTSAPLAGAHNYMLFDANGRGYNVEAMSTRRHVTPSNGESLIHTNHCLTEDNKAVERKRTAESQASSEARLARAAELLSAGTVDVAGLMELTRDEAAICVRPKPPMHVETCGAAIMRPATREMWAVWGLPSENAYEHFALN